MRRGIFAFIAAAILIAAYALGQRAEEPAPGRNAGMNVVVIVIDALRPDHLGCYGYYRNTSPNIDRLCEKGIVYDRAFTQGVWTKPSVATIFTSKYPSVHRTYAYSLNGSPDIADNRLPDQETTFAESLSYEGYATGGFFSNGFISAPLNYGQGFQEYVRMILSTKLNNDRNLTEHAKSMIERKKGRKFFIYAHYLATHAPYAQDPKYKSMFDRGINGSLNMSLSEWPDREYAKEDLEEVDDAYDMGVRFGDEQVGAIVKTLEDEGIMDRTIIVVTADHGESLGEHNHIGHSRITQSVFRIPLIIYDPLNGRGRRVQEPVGLIDLAPTVLTMLNITVPEGYQGGDIFHDRRRYEIIEGYGTTNDAVAGITDGRYLYVHTKSDKNHLYDLKDGPEEKNDLIGKYPAVEKALADALTRHSNMTQHETAANPNELDALKSLGYVF
ncbi:MAG: sulfatase [Candidatus Altiarchaeota archaeon]